MHKGTEPKKLPRSQNPHLEKCPSFFWNTKGEYQKVYGTTYPQPEKPYPDLPHTKHEPAQVNISPKPKPRPKKTHKNL